MREIVLRQFFDGEIDVAALAREVAGSADRQVAPGGALLSSYSIEDMRGEFEVEPRHLVRLLDAVAAGALDLDALDTVCFALEASDRFWWDHETPGGERVADALFRIGSPEINDPLTPPTLARIRQSLLEAD